MNSTYTNNGWEVSLLEYDVENKKKYKVIRRSKNHYKAETKIFDSKKDATKLFDEWIDITA